MGRMVWSLHEVDGRGCAGRLMLDLLSLGKGLGTEWCLWCVARVVLVLSWTGLDRLDKDFGSQCYGFGYDTPW